MKRWPHQPLLDLAKLTRGTEPGSNSYTDPVLGTRFLRVGDITGKTNNPVYTNADNLVLISGEDVLFALDGTPGHVSTGQSGAISSGIRKIEVIDKHRTSPGWLRYALSSPDVQMIIKQHTRGVTILHASSAVPYIHIPVPPLAEQERIVKLLDEVDELRKLRAQADRRTAALIPSLFYEMLAGAEERNCPWPKTTLAGLCSRVVDCPHATPTYATNETLYACVRSSDIQEGKLDWSSTKYVDESEYAKRVKSLIPRPGDVVFCREGARLGNAALVTKEKEVCLGQRMMLFRVELKVATPEFLCALLLSPTIQKVIWSLAGGSASPHLNVGDVKEFVTALPPLPLQKEFAARVGEIHAMQAEQTASRRRLEDLFQSLLHRAFNGEI